MRREKAERKVGNREQGTRSREQRTGKTLRRDKKQKKLETGSKEQGTGNREDTDKGQGTGDRRKSGQRHLVPIDCTAMTLTLHPSAMISFTHDTLSL